MALTPAHVEAMLAPVLVRVGRLEAEKARLEATVGLLARALGAEGAAAHLEAAAAHAPAVALPAAGDGDVKAETARVADRLSAAASYPAATLPLARAGDTCALAVRTRDALGMAEAAPAGGAGAHVGGDAEAIVEHLSDVGLAKAQKHFTVTTQGERARYYPVAFRTAQGQQQRLTIHRGMHDNRRGAGATEAEFTFTPTRGGDSEYSGRVHARLSELGVDGDGDARSGSQVGGWQSFDAGLVVWLRGDLTYHVRVLEGHLIDHEMGDGRPPQHGWRAEVEGVWDARGEPDLPAHNCLDPRVDDLAARLGDMELAGIPFYKFRSRVDGPRASTVRLVLDIVKASHTMFMIAVRGCTRVTTSVTSYYGPLLLDIVGYACDRDDLACAAGNTHGTPGAAIALRYVRHDGSERVELSVTVPSLYVDAWTFIGNVTPQYPGAHGNRKFVVLDESVAAA